MFFTSFLSIQSLYFHFYFSHFPKLFLSMLNDMMLLNLHINTLLHLLHDQNKNRKFVVVDPYYVLHHPRIYQLLEFFSSLLPKMMHFLDLLLLHSTNHHCQTIKRRMNRFQQNENNTFTCLALGFISTP